MNLLATLKNAASSKTVWGVVIAALPTVLGLFNLHVTDVAAFAQGAQDIVDQTLALFGAVMAIYGRVKATSAIVVKK